MTATRSSPLEFAQAVGKSARDAAGMLRRMVISLADGAVWQVLGHILLEGDQETRDAEVFTGIGFAAYPASSDDGGEVEAIIGFPGGGGGGPIILAARQESVRAQLAGDLRADETQIHGAIGAGGTIVRIMRDGTVEIRSAGGTAKRLLTVEDGENLVTAIADAIPVSMDGGAALQASILDGLSSWPTGTSVLKGE